MNSLDIYEIEEFFNEEADVLTSKPAVKASKRKWREIENYKEKQRLRRELQEYSQYGL